MIHLDQSLIRCRPIGVGSGEVESIISFLRRVAIVNHVQFDEILNYVADTSDQPIPRNKRGQITAYWLAKVIDGRGGYVEAFVRRLEELIGIPELGMLTLGRWSRLFKGGLVREGRYFDPASSMDYEMLLCCVKEVYRTHTGALLECRCPNPVCGTSAVVAQMSGSIRMCADCGCSLDRYSGSTMSDEQERGRHIFYTKCIGEMLAYGGNTCGFSVQESVYGLLSFLDVHNWSAAGRALGISRKLVRSWCEDGKLPKFEKVLVVLYNLRLSPIDFFQQRFLPVGSSAGIRLDPKPRKGGARKAYDRDEVTSKMKADMKRDRCTRMPVRRYCQLELGHCYDKVRSDVPGLTGQFEAIVAERKDCRADAALFGRKAEICRAAMFCEAKGLTPNSRNLSPFLERPGRIREPWAESLVRRVIKCGAETVMEELFTDSNRITQNTIK